MTHKQQLTMRAGSVQQTLEVYPFLTNGALRNNIFFNTDGFADSCVIRVGRKILIDWDALESWLDAHRGGAQ